MKKRIEKVNETEAERLKKMFALPQKEFEKALYGNVEDLIKEKKLRAYIKKHKKEIDEINKHIDIDKIFKKVQAFTTAPRTVKTSVK